jgi:hypothetical protein
VGAFGFIQRYPTKAAVAYETQAKILARRLSLALGYRTETKILNLEVDPVDEFQAWVQVDH